MDLYKEILISLLSKERMCVLFPNFKLSPEAVVHSTALQILKDIKSIIENTAEDDTIRIQKIHEILCVYTAVEQKERKTPDA